MPTASTTEWAPRPTSQFFDPVDAGVPSLLDDVGGSEVNGELLPILVAAHGDDALCAELLCGKDPEEADRSVADDGDSLAGARVSSDGGKPSGAEDV